MLSREFQVSNAQSTHAATCASEARSLRQLSPDGQITRKLSGDESAGLLPRLRQSLKATRNDKQGSAVAESVRQERCGFFKEEVQLIMMDPVAGVRHSYQTAIANRLQSRIRMGHREKTFQPPEDQRRRGNLPE